MRAIGRHAKSAADYLKELATLRSQPKVRNAACSHVKLALASDCSWKFHADTIPQQQLSKIKN
jgi:hypothetical protein